MRILVCAFACAPQKGSEPGAGWAVVEAAACAGHDVTLLTARHNKSAMERGLRAQAVIANRVQVEYVGMPAALHRIWESVHRPGKQLHYLLCQRGIGKIACRLHQEQRFDVAHHVTIAADYMPCGVSRVAGLPLVWGPVGGAQRIPDACRPWLGWRGRSLELARRSLADPLRRAGGLRTARRAGLVVAQNDDAARFWSDHGIQSTTRPNVFLHDPEHDDVTPPPWNADSERRRAVFVGRLVAWKGVHLALATMTEPAALGWELHFFGTGPEERRLRSGIRAHGLEDRVHLNGLRSRGEIRALLLQADALLFPSIARLRPVGRRRGALGRVPRGLPPDGRSGRTGPTGRGAGDRGHGTAAAPTGGGACGDVNVASSPGALERRRAIGAAPGVVPTCKIRMCEPVRRQGARSIASVLALALFTVVLPVCSVAAAKPNAVNPVTVTPRSGTPPPSAVALPVGANAQALVTRYPAGTAFEIDTGIHSDFSVVPKSQDTFYAAPGAVLDGLGVAPSAFRERRSSPQLASP